MEENVIQTIGGITINDTRYIWNPAVCSCENVKYLASIMEDSTIKCDKKSHRMKKQKQFQPVLMKGNSL